MKAVNSFHPSSLILHHSIHLPHALGGFAADAGVEGQVGQAVEVLHHVASPWVQYFKGNFTGKTNLFAAAIFVHVGFDVVAGDDDMLDAKVAHRFFGFTATEGVPVIGELAEDERRIGQDVHVAMGDAAHAEGGGSAEVQADFVMVGVGGVGGGPTVKKGGQAIIAGECVAARGAEDFADVKGAVF